MDNFSNVIDYIIDMEVDNNDKYVLKYLYERAYITHMFNIIFGNDSKDVITFVENGVFPNNYFLSLFDIRVEYLYSESLNSVVFFPKELLKIENITKYYKKYFVDKLDDKCMKKINKKVINHY